MPDDLKLSSVFAPDQPQQKLGFADGLQAATGKLIDYFDSAKNRAIMQEAEKMVETQYSSKDDMATIKMPAALLPHYQQAIQGYQTIQDNYHKMSLQNEARIAQQKAHPWANTLATIAGSLAANDRNPITRGLGQAAQKLNPSMDELQARQMQLLQGQGQAAGQGLQAAEGYQRAQMQMAAAGADQERLKLEKQREDRLASNAGKTAHAAQLALAQKAATSRTLTPESRAAYNLLSDEEFGALAAESAQAAKVKADDAKALVKSKVEMADLTQNARVKAEKELIPLREAAAKRVAEARSALSTGEKSERAGESREFKAYEKIQPGVRAVLDVRDAAGKLRTLIQENPDAVGVLEGRVPEMFITRQQAKVRAEFFTLLDAVRQSISGGTRFWNPQEFKNLSPKLAMASKTERANLGILDAIEDFANRGARNIVKTNPYVAWNKVSDVWGDYGPEIFGATEGGGKTNPAAKSVDEKKGAKKYKPGDDPLGLGVK